MDSVESRNSTGTWLITGGCGFIGTALIRQLTETGADVRIRVLDNLAVGKLDDLARVCSFEELTLEDAASVSIAPVQMIVGDIRDEETCLRAARGCDVIVHLAANTGVPASIADPRLDCDQNVKGTLNMLEAARKAGVKRFVLASSNAPIGDCEPPVNEKIAPRPLAPYGASKLAGEGYCSAYFHSFGLETAALRFGNVYGPLSGHKNSVVAKFLKQAMNGETLEIYGDGNQTRDFIYIADLVRALQNAAETHGIGGEVFQISASSETTVNELLHALVSALESFGITGVKSTHGKPRPGDIRRNCSDTRKARKMLGWQAEMNLKEGLKRTVEWFVK